MSTINNIDRNGLLDAIPFEGRSDYQQLGGNASAPQLPGEHLNPRLEIAIGRFTKSIGNLPFMEPNVRDGTEGAKDVALYVNGEPVMGSSTFKCLCNTITALTGIGACYLLSKMVLIKEGDYGFTMDNGVPKILLPGRHWLSSPVNMFVMKRSAGDDLIEMSPITIVRVQQGNLGFATENGQPEILLPGVHIRKSPAFKYNQQFSLNNPRIIFGPLKIVTVRSGSVQVCYHEGKVKIYQEGRYAINSGTFEVAETILIQQQNLRFSQHPVLLDGGIGMLVEGLLTYQVTDVEQLIKELGNKDLQRAIQDVTKAELSRVFSTIHLEQITYGSQGDPGAPPAKPGLLGEGGVQDAGSVEGQSSNVEARTMICSSVIAAIQPYTASWGVKIINFQLESTKIADKKYAEEYEEASLGLAKAKANQRAITAQNEIMLQKANAEAVAGKIKAEGIKASVIITAEGAAEARKIDARARNDAAKMMQDDFAKQFALSGQQVEFAKGLKATSITVLPDSAVGKPMASAFVLGTK